MHGFCTLDIQCQFVSMSLKSLERSLQFIIQLSSFCLNLGAKQVVIDVEDSVVYGFKAFEVGGTFKFNNCLNMLDFVINRWFSFNSHCFVLTSFSTTTQCSLLFASLNFARWLDALGLLDFAMISHHWALVKGVASCFICFLLRVIESEGLESNTSMHLPTKCTPTTLVQSVYLGGRLFV